MSLNLQFMYVLIVPKVLQSIFPVACFWGLSDVHECYGIVKSRYEDDIVYIIQSRGGAKAEGNINDIT